MIYSPTPYLNLQRRIATLPPYDPDERVKRLLEQLKDTHEEYPPELLKATREKYISQVKEKAGQSANHPAGT